MNQHPNFIPSEIFFHIETDNSYACQQSSKLMMSRLSCAHNASQIFEVTLTKQNLYIENLCSTIYAAQINFQLKFQVILENEEILKSRKIGFKILKQNCQESISFYHSSVQIVQKWVQALQNLISQLGFHKHFKAVRKLGKGQFATVFEVEHHQTNRKYAVKGFSKLHLKKCQKGMEGLLNEIKIMRSFSHPNLQKLHCVYESQNSIYLVTQLLKGGSLFERLQKLNKDKKKISNENIKQFMIGFLQGLKKLSQLDIAHRDLKLDNIMLRSVGSFEPVIIDFGLSTFTQQAQYLFYKCGTPGYVSPQVMSSTKFQKINSISDIFSAGAIFHHFLTQRPAFEGKNCDQVLKRNRSFQLNFREAIYTQIQIEALQLLQKMMEINQNKRISAREALQHQYFMQSPKQISPVTTTICESQKLIYQQIKF